MKVCHFNEAVMPWHFKVCRHSGTGRGGGGGDMSVTFIWVWALNRAPPVFWRENRLDTNSEHVWPALSFYICRIAMSRSKINPFLPLLTIRERKSYFRKQFFGTETAKLQPSKYFCVFNPGVLVIIVNLNLFWKFFKKWNITLHLIVRCWDGVKHVSTNLPSPFSCVYPHIWASLAVSLLDTASKVPGAAVRLWPSAGDWKGQYLSPRWGPGRHWAPLPSLWNLPLWWLADHTTLRAL